MKNKFKTLFETYPFLKFLGNKYVIVLVFFAIWMLFLDNTSYLVHRELDKQIQELEDNKTYYQQEINKDKKSIEKLNDPDQIEHYAREKYFMKKDSEDIYIIDYEEDDLRKKDSLSKL